MQYYVKTVQSDSTQGITDAVQALCDDFDFEPKKMTVFYDSSTSTVCYACILQIYSEGEPTEPPFKRYNFQVVHATDPDVFNALIQSIYDGPDFYDSISGMNTIFNPSTGLVEYSLALLGYNKP
jgi:hypothetical protein